MQSLLSWLSGDKRVNGRALLILAVGLIVLGGSVYLVHGYQVHRNAHGLLAQADQVERAGQARQAAQLLEQYLGLRPDDNDALERYGLLLERLATNDRGRLRAFFALEQVLRRDRKRGATRLEVARLANRLGRFSDAKEHLEMLLQQRPEASAELMHLYAQALAGQHDYQKASEWYSKALQKAPGQPEISVEYAALLRGHLERDLLADDLIEQMVAVDRRAPQLRLEAARYFRRFGQTEPAWRHLRFALDELGPPSADVLVLAGELAAARGEFEQARAHLEQGRARFPQDPRLTRALADMELRRGEREKALAYLGESLRLVPQQPEELWELANLLIDAGATERARALISQLSKNAPPALSGLLEARLLMRESRWGAASKLLQKVAAERRLPQGLARHAHFLLANCYDRLGNPDQRLAAYQRAVEADPLWLHARHGLATALAALGKLDAAIAEYTKLAAQAPEVRPELGRLLVVRALHQPAALRDWPEVERFLTRLSAADKERSAFRLLQAEVLAARGKIDEARALAEAERERDPQQVEPWLFLVALATRSDPGADINALLDEAEQRAGKQPEWLMARAVQALRTTPAQARQQLEALQARLSEFTGADHDRLLAGLAEACAAAGDETAARRLWSHYAERKPDEAAVRFVLFEAALAAKDEADAGRQLEQLRRLEGGEGAWTAYGEAALRLLHAGKDDSPARKEARALLARAAALRPSWSRVPLLEAALYDQEGQHDKALEKYQAALEGGEGRLTVVRRVLQLLYERQRYGEAQALLRKLPKRAVTSAALGRLAAEVTLQGQKAQGQDPAAARQEALALARQAVTNDSTDYRDYLWLGEMEAALGQKEAAEKALQRACALNGAAPECWTALVSFLARTDPSKADSELDRMQRQLPRDNTPLALAACYEALGRSSQAAQQFEQAVAARPADPVVLRNAALFYARHNKPEHVEPLLRKLLQPATGMPEAQSGGARRTLALALAAQGGYPRFQEAQLLLDQNRKLLGETPEDRQTRALVLATQPAFRRAAIKLCDELVSSGQRSVPDELRFVLAQLHSADGNWGLAERHLLILLEAHERNTVYLARYIAGSLRHGRPETAELWLDRLAEIAPRATETLDLRVQLLQATGRSTAAAALVHTYAREQGARLDLAAQWLEQLGAGAEAEKMYRAFAATAGRADAVLPLALYLGRQKRVAEALQICETAWATCRPEAVASASLDVLRRGRPSAEQRRQVEDWIARSIKKHPRVAALPGLLAEAYEQQGRYGDARRLYGDMLRQDPRHIVALNNQAFLLALEQQETGTALDLIGRAIDLAGPADELLDTRAVVYLRGNQPAPAIKDLQAAIAQAPSPVKYFHLAQAEALAQHRPAARAALRKGRELGLQAEQLHPLERPAFQRLLEELAN